MRYGLIAWAMVTSLYAQNDMIANINLQFRLVNPGARAQAMGGAFVGLADDSTAVFANPAGLTRLASKTMVFELGQSRNQNEIPFYSGTIRQTGLQDFEFDLQSKDFPETTTSVPFLCYIQPTSAIKWGVFYSENMNVDRSFQSDEVYLPHEPDDDRPVSDFTDFTFFPSDNQIEMTVRQLGVSVAGGWETFSAGLTLTSNQIDYQARTDLLFPDVFPAGHPLEPYVGSEAARITTDGDDSSIAFYGGLLFHPNDRFSMGISYKNQPDFDYDYAVSSFDFQQGGLVSIDSGIATFQLPDNLSAGCSFKTSEVFLISFEANRVFYSELVDDYQQFFDAGGYTQTIEDGTEYHVGMEYFFTQFLYPFAVRGGYWFEPYHALTNTFLDTQILYRQEDNFQNIRNAVFLQRFEEDTNHITFGFGLNLGRHFTLDLAMDFSDPNDQMSLSGIYRF